MSIWKFCWLLVWCARHLAICLNRLPSNTVPLGGSGRASFKRLWTRQYYRTLIEGPGTKFNAPLFKCLIRHYFFNQKMVRYFLYPLRVCSAMPNFFANQWTAAWQSPLPMEFSRQEYWSGLPFPPSGDIPD